MSDKSDQNPMLNEIIHIVTGKKTDNGEAGLLSHAENRRKTHMRHRITAVLAVLLIFVVMYALILPGIALTKDDQTLACGYEVHEHTDACYRIVKDENGSVTGKELICGKADWAIHTHNRECFADIQDADGNTQKILVCELPEIKEHRHDASCYQDQKVLICGKEESDGHTHTDACYSTEKVLTCSVEEHVHEDSCYRNVDKTERVPVCGNEDPGHVHVDSCYAERQSTERVPVCGKEEHRHGAACYEEVRMLTCGQAQAEEHHHDDSCYETRKELVCGQLALHTHTKGCYEAGHENDPAYLICGKLELKEHTHGAGCLEKNRAADEEIIEKAEEAAGKRLAKAESLAGMSAYEAVPDDIVEHERTAAGEVGNILAELTGERQAGHHLILMSEGTEKNADESERLVGEQTVFFMNEDDEEQTVFFTDEDGKEHTVFFMDEEGEEQIDSFMNEEEKEQTDSFMNEGGEEQTDSFVNENDEGQAGIITDEDGEEQAESPRDPATEEQAEEEAVPEEPDTEEGLSWPEQVFTAATGTVLVEILAEEGTFPAGTTLKVEDVRDEGTIDAILDAVDGDIRQIHAVNITFEYQGSEIEPAKPVSVVMTPLQAVDIVDPDPQIVHVDDSGEVNRIDPADDRAKEEIIEAANVTAAEDAVVFEAESFSVYALVYTVDFEYSVNGEVYDFGLPGGEKITLSELAEVLGILAGTQFETARDFLREVQDVSFSDPTLVAVAGIAEDATVGAIKDTLGLESQYSDELTEEKVREIDASTVSAGDWVLISLKAFDSEEALTITMKNGDVITVMVTDAQIKKTIMTAFGETWEITVTYGEEAEIPEGAELEAFEVLEGSSVNGKSYEDYVAYTENALGWEAGSALYARVFDISIVDGEGEKIQPAAGSTVDVRIELADADGEKELNVVHFADEENAGDVVESSTDEQTVSFEAHGFSAYAIVQGPEAVLIGWHKVSSVAELIGMGSEGLYIGHKNGYYFGNTLVSEGSRTGIAKTKPAQSTPPTNVAAKYYFEPVEGKENQVYVYCYAADGTTKQYVYNNSDNSLSFAENAEEKTAFTVMQNNNGTFKFNNGAWYWNMQGGEGGSRFCSYNSANDGNNEVYIWFYDKVTRDPYDLNGKSFGLMNWNGSVTGRAMMAESNTTNAMDAKSLIVMSKLNNSSQLFVPNDSDITMWTFEWAGDDLYYLKATIDGATQYLQITSSGLSMTGTKDDSCKIQVIPGSGSNAGQICLKAGGKTLTYSGSLNNGFSVGGSAGSEWLYLVNLSELTSDYFMTHTASKISVSDTSVTNGSHVIVYTRTWNDTDKKYEFYAIDSDGSLVRCYENGDTIQWVGELLNNMLWDFVEYYWEGTSDPNYYYELFNEYSEKYLAPQVTNGQILSGETIGINMNGRRNGYYYSNIVAWDDTYYAYAGLKADMDTGKIVSCPLSEAGDFYFAVVQDLPVDDTLNTVQTIDHTKYGITMKIRDFSSREQMSDFLGSNDGGAVYTTVSGLLSTKLGEDGYPVVTSSKVSLGDLYSGSYDVNKLFIASTYEASGYFEFDSTQNFASLQGNEFRVYQQLGTTNEGKNTLKHGQFLPFNDIEAGRFSTNNRYNLYSATGRLLPDSDPRKYEQLYVTTQAANYYYGVELEASFTQTANGKDDWGHDIIYEFTGDDDFWLYVNGELVIDLGGIHSALAGSVNFSTGKVYVNGKETTLLETFRNNYMTREGITDKDDPGVIEYLKQYFDYDEDTGSFSEIFKEYSTNTMRIFYMERGAGAANLHMRFNLASVRPGHVFLSKELKGIDTSESVLAEFPYQIYYKKVNDKTEYLLSQDDNPLNISVSYKDTTTRVPYRDSITIGDAVYQSVFLLKPGEIADIAVPDDAISYRIVECGVSTEVYSSVSVKEDSVFENIPKDANSQDVSGRKDYTLEYKDTTERPRVTYENTVNPDAVHSLNITKKLFKEDGQTEISDDDTEFSFRLYLAPEFDENINDDAAYMQAYYVKDPAGYYCKWDSDGKMFISLEKGDFASLSNDEKKQAVFHTSMNGAISKIPANYTVEIRNLLAGTRYKVVERPYEIPDGYSFQKYIQNDTVSDNAAGTGVSEGIKPDTDETVVVCNVRGWGLRVNKVWSDESYMESRDPAYFAVFTDDGNGNLTLVPATRTSKNEDNKDVSVSSAKDEYGNDTGTVRQLTYGEKSIYWYFPVLPVSTATNLESYVIREVELIDPTIDANGNVKSYKSLKIKDGGDEISFTGKQKGDSSAGSFIYKVQYEPGTVEDGAQVRVDKVGNTRPGIVLKKTDWQGKPLSGAIFELRDSSNNLIGEFTSDENGYISTAFMSNDGAVYTLKEIKSPQGYQGIPCVINISQRADTVTVSGIDSDYYALVQGTGQETSLSIKNRPFTLQAVKKDADSNSPMKGVKFELYKQQTVNGVTSMVLVAGYESITTDQDGVVTGISSSLPAGTYALKEKETLNGYDILKDDIYFLIDSAGVVTLGLHPDGVVLSPETVSKPGEGDATGLISYELTIFNSQKKKVSFQKVDIADTSRVLEGAVFDLYGVEAENGNETRVIPARYTGLKSNSGGMLEDGSGNTVFDLPVGKYQLVETAAPSGYIIKESAVTVTVSATDVSYEEGTNISSDGGGKTYDPDSKVYTLKVSNSAGYELPSTGGSGTTLFTILGSILIAISGAVLWRRRR